MNLSPLTVTESRTFYIVFLALVLMACLRIIAFLVAYMMTDLLRELWRTVLWPRFKAWAERKRAERRKFTQCNHGWLLLACGLALAAHSVHATGLFRVTNNSGTNVTIFTLKSGTASGGSGTSCNQFTATPGVTTYSDSCPSPGQYINCRGGSGSGPNLTPVDQVASSSTYDDFTWPPSSGGGGSPPCYHATQSIVNNNDYAEDFRIYSLNGTVDFRVTVPGHSTKTVDIAPSDCHQVGVNVCRISPLDGSYLCTFYQSNNLTWANTNAAPASSNLLSYSDPEAMGLSPSNYFAAGQTGGTNLATETTLKTFANQTHEDLNQGLQRVIDTSAGLRGDVQAVGNAVGNDVAAVSSMATDAAARGVTEIGHLANIAAYTSTMSSKAVDTAANTLATSTGVSSLNNLVSNYQNQAHSDSLAISNALASGLNFTNQDTARIITNKLDSLFMTENNYEQVAIKVPVNTLDYIRDKLFGSYLGSNEGYLERAQNLLKDIKTNTSGTDPVLMSNAVAGAIINSVQQSFTNVNTDIRANTVTFSNLAGWQTNNGARYQEYGDILGQMRTVLGSPTGPSLQTMTTNIAGDVQDIRQKVVNVTNLLTQGNANNLQMLQTNSAGFITIRNTFTNSLGQVFAAVMSNYDGTMMLAGYQLTNQVTQSGISNLLASINNKTTTNIVNNTNILNNTNIVSISNVFNPSNSIVVTNNITVSNGNVYVTVTNESPFGTNAMVLLDPYTNSVTADEAIAQATALMGPVQEQVDGVISDLHAMNLPQNETEAPYIEINTGVSLPGLMRAGGQARGEPYKFIFDPANSQFAGAIQTGKNLFWWLLLLAYGMRVTYDIGKSISLVLNTRGRTPGPIERVAQLVGTGATFEAPWLGLAIKGVAKIAGMATLMAVYAAFLAAMCLLLAGDIHFSGMLHGITQNPVAPVIHSQGLKLLCMFIPLQELFALVVAYALWFISVMVCTAIFQAAVKWIPGA